MTLPPPGSPPTRISDSDNALRRVRTTDVRVDGAVKKQAFLPRKGGRDRDGLSVSIQREALIEVHRMFFTAPGKRAAVVVVQAVRNLELDVVASATVEDPAHALIVGIPDRDTEPLQAERIAELLAHAAGPYEFPPA